MGMMAEADVRAFIVAQAERREEVARIVSARRASGDTGTLRVDNAASGQAEMWLIGDIGMDPWTGTGISAQDVANELQAITASALTIHIHSGGGDLFEALGIYAAIKNHPAVVTTQVDGLAASAASIVAMAGDKVLMSRGAMMMIHEPKGISIGASAEHQKMADVLNQIADNMVGIYADHGGRRTNWRTKMQAETWYTDQQAVAAGLANEVAGTPAVKNDIDLSVYGYAHVPEALAKAQTSDDVAAPGAVQHITNNYYGQVAPPPDPVHDPEPTPDPDKPAASSQDRPDGTEQSEGLSVVSARLLIDLAEAEVMAIA